MLKRNLFALFSITTFAIASTVLCISNYDPFSSNMAILAQFYGSLLFSITGITAFIIYYAKLNLYKNSATNAFFGPSVRQGFLVGICLTVTLMLKGLKLLDSWIILPLAFICVLLELFFQSQKNVSCKDTAKVSQ